MPKFAKLDPRKQDAALALHFETVNRRGGDETFLREILEYLGIRKAGAALAPAGICPTCGAEIPVSRATNPRTGANRAYCSNKCVPA